MTAIFKVKRVLLPQDVVLDTTISKSTSKGSVNNMGPQYYKAKEFK
jgi:hypothetical protein